MCDTMRLKVYLILHSTLNFRQNTRICRKKICEAKFHTLQQSKSCDYFEVVALLVDVENLEAGHVVALPGVVLVHVLVVVNGDRVRFVRRLELRVL